MKNYVIEGFKGYKPGLICRDKKYKENEAFKEAESSSGMHFYVNPLFTFDFYPPYDFYKFNEYTKVCSNQNDCTTIKNKIYCTHDIKIKNKLNLKQLSEEAVGYSSKNNKKYTTYERFSVVKSTDESSAAVAERELSTAIVYYDYSVAMSTCSFSIAICTGACSIANAASDTSIAISTGKNAAATTSESFSVAVNTGGHSLAHTEGYRSIAISTGFKSGARCNDTYSAAIVTGDLSVASAEGKNSFAIALGFESVAKGTLGSWLVCVEWKLIRGIMRPVDVRTAFVDGYKIKADTYYTLEDGEFVEVLYEELLKRN